MFRNIFINLLCASLVVGANSILKMALVNKGFSWRGSFVGLGRDLLHLLSFPLIWVGILLFYSGKCFVVDDSGDSKIGNRLPIADSPCVFVFHHVVNPILWRETHSDLDCWVGACDVWRCVNLKRVILVL